MWSGINEEPTYGCIQCFCSTRSLNEAFPSSFLPCTPHPIRPQNLVQRVGAISQTDWWGAWEEESKGKSNRANRTQLKHHWIQPVLWNCHYTVRNWPTMVALETQGKKERKKNNAETYTVSLHTNVLNNTSSQKHVVLWNRRKYFQPIFSMESSAISISERSSVYRFAVIVSLRL